MVYGIIKQHDGLIHVYSEPGHGTTFKIYLLAAEQPAEKEVIETPSALRGGLETILVAEDEEALRKLAREVLAELGYTVWLARDGEEAVELYAAHRDEIDLVALDVVMPRLGGPAAYAQMRQLNEHLPVIFMTGYSAEIVRGQTTHALVLQKPYHLNDLAGKVREALDQAKSQSFKAP